MAAAPIATSLFCIPVVLYIFVAISIPTFFNSWNFPIIAITLTTFDGNINSLNLSTGIDGTLNNVTFSNLLNIDFGFWTACFEQGDEFSTNLKGIDYKCLPPVALGYTIDVEPVPGSNIFNSTIVVVPYTVPIFFILAWLATLIGVLVTGHPYHYIVKGAAVVLTGFAVGTQYMLFTSAKKVAPNFGFFATTSLGVGFYIVTGSLIFLVLGTGLFYIETK